MIDWKNLDRTEIIRVVQVSPTDINTEWGELDGVDLSGCSLETAYYSDTREHGSISVYGDGWKRGSFIRIYLDIPEFDYSEPLGTYIVVGQKSHLEKGVWKHDLSLQSILKGLSTEKLPRPWALAVNSSVKKCIEQNLETASRPYVDESANDVKIKTPSVIETGTSRLSALFSLTNASSNRLDVDAYGRVTIEPYKLPASKASSFVFDLDDVRGIMEDSLDLTNDWLEIPDQVVISHKYTEQQSDKSVEKEINAVAYMPNEFYQSRNPRGYTITDFRSISELTPRTAVAAQNLATAYLKRDSTEQVEWQMRCHYLPLRSGDVVTLVVPSGDYSGNRKCLVKNTKLSLGDMTLALTLKETASGDDE